MRTPSIPHHGPLRVHGPQLTSPDLISATPFHEHLETEFSTRFRKISLLVHAAQGRAEN